VHKIAHKSIAMMLLFCVTLLVISPELPTSLLPIQAFEFDRDPSATSLERATGAAPAEQDPEELEVSVIVAEAFVLFAVSSIVLIRREEDQLVLAGVGAVIFVPPKIY
jgi:hypothetical protein